MSLFHSPRIVTDGLVLCLDAGNPKSYPVTPELITNGTFNSNVNGWTAFNSTNTWSSGKMQITRSGGTGATTYQTFTTIAGQTYIVTAEVNSLGSRGDLRIRDGTGWGGSSLLAINGTNAQTVTLSGNFTAISTETTLGFAVDGNGTSIVVDNISISPSSPLWADLSGNGNNASLTNMDGANLDSANSGSFTFDGINEYVSTGAGISSPISFGQSKSFTIELFFEINDFSTSQAIISRRNNDSSTATDYILYYSSSNMVFGTGSATDSGAWRNLGNAFNYNNQIMHFCGVISSTGAQTGTKVTYKNGVQIDSISYAVKASTTANSTFIGKYNGDGFYLNGKVYNVKIYNRALTPQEVQQNYLALKSRYIN